MASGKSTVGMSAPRLKPGAGASLPWSHDVYSRWHGGPPPDVRREPLPHTAFGAPLSRDDAFRTALLACNSTTCACPARVSPSFQQHRDMPAIIQPGHPILCAEHCCTVMLQIANEAGGASDLSHRHGISPISPNTIPGNEHPLRMTLSGCPFTQHLPRLYKLCHYRAQALSKLPFQNCPSKTALPKLPSSPGLSPGSLLHFSGGLYWPTLHLCTSSCTLPTERVS